MRHRALTAPARSKTRDAPNAELGKLTEKKSSETWATEPDTAGAPLRPDLIDDAQVQRARPPEFGERTEEVPAESGFGADEVAALQQSKVV